MHPHMMLMINMMLLHNICSDYSFCVMKMNSSFKSQDIQKLFLNIKGEAFVWI